MEIDEQASTAPPHGQKRQPDDDLESEQRLAKRFNLLNIENVRNLYIPVPARPATSPTQRKRSNAFSDSMSVDETRDRVYIHDLDEEIADIESDDEKLIFIPDIEKRLTKIPKSVLLGKEPSEASNEVVLYGVPESLTVPHEKDSVRKAIIESRNRIREKQSHSSDEVMEPGPSRFMNGARAQHSALDFPPTFAQSAPTGSQSQSTNTESQEDAMDIG